MPQLPDLESLWQDFPLLEDAWPLLLLVLRLVIALGLYLFLFSAFRALLVELRPAARIPAAAPAADARRRREADRQFNRESGLRPRRESGPPRWLEVIDCDGAPELIGRRYPLERVTVVGREVASTAVLPDPRVSARHARLVSRNGDWWVEDLDSMNGTYVDDEPVDGATLVDPEAELRFGPVVARLAAESTSR